MSMAMELSRLAPRNWFRREEPRTDMSMMPARELMPVSRLHRDIDRWFDEFMSEFGFPRIGSMAWPEGPTLFRPQLDVVEGKDAYTITVEVPGMDRKDIQLELRENTLVVSGEKRRESRQDGDAVYRVERSYGRFERLLELPDDAESDRIEARHANGVLTISVPRNAARSGSQARRIEIRAS